MHLFVSFVLVLCVSCATQPSQMGGPPVLPDAGPDGEYSLDWPDLGRGPSRYISIDLGPDSLDHCRRVSPRFPFDSAKTRAQDRAQLVALASCLNHPSMATRKILLIGRADARGADAHNAELGVRRANRIRDLLVEGGIDVARIRTTSAGEDAAVGDEPDFSFGYDRRVDIVVGSAGQHAP